MKQNYLRTKLGTAKGFDPFASSTVIGMAKIAKQKNDEVISKLYGFYPDFGLEIASIIGEEQFHAKFEGLKILCIHLAKYPCTSLLQFKCDKCTIHKVDLPEDFVLILDKDVSEQFKEGLASCPTILISPKQFGENFGRNTAITLEFRLPRLSPLQTKDKTKEEIRLQLKESFEKTFLPKIEKALKNGVSMYASWLRRYKPHTSKELVVPLVMLPCEQTNLGLPIINPNDIPHKSPETLAIPYGKQ